MTQALRTNRYRIALIGILATGFAGCASNSAPAESTLAEVTYDGLHKVRDSDTSVTWARPDLDLGGYTKVKLRGAGIEFRPGGESGQSTGSRRGGGPYEITEEQKAEVIEIMTEAFLKEFESSQTFELVDTTGPDVLLVHGGILDVISYVPPGQPGFGVQLVAVGEATLVVEIRDSITDAILIRAIDRRAAERNAGEMFESGRVNNSNELRRLAQSWATLLRTRIEEFMVAP